MNEALLAVVITAALLGAAGTGILVWRDKRADRSVIVGLAVVELAALVQLIASIADLAGGDRPEGNTAEFVLYAVATVLVVPAGLAWSIGDRSRWGLAVTTVACLVLAIMSVRMDQIWNG